MTSQKISQFQRQIAAVKTNENTAEIDDNDVTKIVESHNFVKMIPPHDESLPDALFIPEGVGGGDGVYYDDCGADSGSDADHFHYFSANAVCTNDFTINNDAQFNAANLVCDDDAAVAVSGDGSGDVADAVTHAEMYGCTLCRYTRLLFLSACFPHNHRLYFHFCTISHVRFENMYCDNALSMPKSCCYGHLVSLREECVWKFENLSVLTRLL